jgi:hypothetical protein
VLSTLIDGLFSFLIRIATKGSPQHNRSNVEQAVAL